MCISFLKVCGCFLPKIIPFDLNYSVPNLVCCFEIVYIADDSYLQRNLSSVGWDVYHALSFRSNEFA